MDTHKHAGTTITHTVSRGGAQNSSLIRLCHFCAINLISANVCLSLFPCLSRFRLSEVRASLVITWVLLSSTLTCNELVHCDLERSHPRQHITHGLLHIGVGLLHTTQTETQQSHRGTPHTQRDTTGRDNTETAQRQHRETQRRQNGKKHTQTAQATEQVRLEDRGKRAENNRPLDGCDNHWNTIIRELTDFHARTHDAARREHSGRRKERHE